MKTQTMRTFLFILLFILPLLVQIGYAQKEISYPLVFIKKGFHSSKEIHVNKDRSFYFVSKTFSCEVGNKNIHSPAITEIVGKYKIQGDFCNLQPDVLEQMEFSTVSLEGR